MRWRAAGCPQLPGTQWTTDLWTIVAHVAPYYPSWPITAPPSLPSSSQEWSDPNMTETLKLVANMSSTK